jgi:hypothetical protein
MSCGSKLESRSLGTIDLHLPALASQRLRRRAVPGVAGVIVGGVLLLIAEVVRQLAVEGSLDEGFRELLKEPVLTEQVIRLPVIDLLQK